MLTPSAARELKMFYRALGDLTRLRIVQILTTEGDQTVAALIRRTRVSPPLMTWHLHRLKRAGLVTTERAGREVRCSFQRDQFASLNERGLRLLMNPSDVPQ